MCTYTVSELFTLQAPAKRLNTTAWHRLWELGICKRGPTIRRCHGGTHRQRNIVTIMGNRPAPALGDSQRGAHLPNLVQVSLHNTRLLEVLVLNCRSVRNKTDLIQQCITESDADIAALTETWLTNSDRDHKWIAALTPTGYKCINVPRPKGQRGGGIAVLHKTGLNCMATPHSDSHRVTSFEHLECRLSAGSLTVDMAFVYRPPPSRKNKLTTALFMQEFPDFLADLALSPHELLVAGDINLHWNKVDTCTDCASIRETLNMLGLVQHVTKATHQEGNILDWVISRRKSCVDSVRVGGLVSDHFAIHCALQTSKPPVPKSLLMYWKFKNINQKALTLTSSAGVYTLTRPPSLWTRWLGSATECSVNWWTSTLRNKPGWWLWGRPICLGLPMTRKWHKPTGGGWRGDGSPQSWPCTIRCSPTSETLSVPSARKPRGSTIRGELQTVSQTKGSSTASWMTSFSAKVTTHCQVMTSARILPITSVPSASVRLMTCARSWLL